jgi:hypothetical protein
MVKEIRAHEGGGNGVVEEKVAEAMSFSAKYGIGIGDLKFPQNQTLSSTTDLDLQTPAADFWLPCSPKILTWNLFLRLRCIAYSALTVVPRSYPIPRTFASHV